MALADDPPDVWVVDVGRDREATKDALVTAINDATAVIYRVLLRLVTTGASPAVGAASAAGGGVGGGGAGGGEGERGAGGEDERDSPHAMLVPYKEFAEKMDVAADMFVAPTDKREKALCHAVLAGEASRLYLGQRKKLFSKSSNLPAYCAKHLPYTCDIIVVQAGRKVKHLQGLLSPDSLAPPLPRGTSAVAATAAAPIPASTSASASAAASTSASGSPAAVAMAGGVSALLSRSASARSPSCSPPLSPSSSAGPSPAQPRIQRGKSLGPGTLGAGARLVEGDEGGSGQGADRRGGRDGREGRDAGASAAAAASPSAGRASETSHTAATAGAAAGVGAGASIEAATAAAAGAAGAAGMRVVQPQAVNLRHLVLARKDLAAMGFTHGGANTGGDGGEGGGAGGAGAGAKGGGGGSSIGCESPMTGGQHQQQQQKQQQGFSSANSSAANSPRLTRALSAGYSSAASSCLTPGTASPGMGMGVFGFASPSPSGSLGNSPSVPSPLAKAVAAGGFGGMPGFHWGLHAALQQQQQQQQQQQLHRLSNVGAAATAVGTAAAGAEAGVMEGVEEEWSSGRSSDRHSGGSSVGAGMGREESRAVAGGETGGVLGGEGALLETHRVGEGGQGEKGVSGSAGERLAQQSYQQKLILLQHLLEQQERQNQQLREQWLQQHHRHQQQQQQQHQHQQKQQQPQQQQQKQSHDPPPLQQQQPPPTQQQHQQQPQQQQHQYQSAVTGSVPELPLPALQPPLEPTLASAPGATAAAAAAPGVSGARGVSGVSAGGDLQQTYQQKMILLQLLLEQQERQNQQLHEQWLQQQRRHHQQQLQQQLQFAASGSVPERCSSAPPSPALQAPSELPLAPAPGATATAAAAAAAAAAAPGVSGVSASGASTPLSAPTPGFPPLPLHPPLPPIPPSQKSPSPIPFSQTPPFTMTHSFSLPASVPASLPSMGLPAGARERMEVHLLLVELARVQQQVRSTQEVAERAERESREAREQARKAVESAAAEAEKRLKAEMEGEAAKKKADEASRRAAAAEAEADRVRREAADLAAAASATLAKAQEQYALSNQLRQQEFREYSIEELARACDMWDEENLVGEGGYGTVYRGVLEHYPVAVKCLKTANSDQALREFKKEMDVQRGLRHPTVVLLIGCCHDPPCLVYELMPHGSLYDRLVCDHGSPPLPWNRRFDIFEDTCKALIHLHNRHPAIVHLDLKPANILLDGNMRAKLGDVGLARFMVGMDSGRSFIQQSVAVGTFGYVDPHFLRTGQFSRESDIYSLGMVLLDMLRGIDTSKKPAGEGRDGEGAGGAARRHVGDRVAALEALEACVAAGDVERLQGLLDPSAGTWPPGIAMRLVEIARRCAAFKRKQRPELSRDVMAMLAEMKPAVLRAAAQQRELGLLKDEAWEGGDGGAAGGVGGGGGVGIRGGGESTRTRSGVQVQVPDGFRCPITM
ncbi:hypothetical protein CLOM_g9861, partial [Closterium sp. NIES-68]